MRIEFVKAAHTPRWFYVFMFVMMTVVVGATVAIALWA